jgi:hypothetical protein
MTSYRTKRSGTGRGADENYETTQNGLSRCMPPILPHHPGGISAYHVDIRMARGQAGAGHSLIQQKGGGGAPGDHNSST